MDRYSNQAQGLGAAGETKQKPRFAQAIESLEQEISATLSIAENLAHRLAPFCLAVPKAVPENAKTLNPNASDVTQQLWRLRSIVVSAREILTDTIESLDI